MQITWKLKFNRKKYLLISISVDLIYDSNLIHIIEKQHERKKGKKIRNSIYNYKLTIEWTEKRQNIEIRLKMHKRWNNW